MNSRPKPGETEEDILKLQEEFLKNKLLPSAKYINCKNSSDKVSVSEQNEVCTKPEESPSLLGGIVERNTQFIPPVSGSKSRFSGGFPQAKRRQNTTTTKKGSIFSQQNKRLKEEKLSETFELENMITEDTASSSIKSNKKLPQQSYIITGVDSDQIHQENINMLNKMSEREILEEQQRLLSTLDPDIVRFLKSKRKHTGPTSAPENKENIFEPPVDVQQIETPREILKNHGSEKWLNFDLIEQEKLQWMKNIDLPRKPNDNQEYEARFDFAGWLLPYSDEISEKNRVLYHHGEEAGRPGYTLKELFQLCRSSVQQQRVLALSTIANVAQLNSTGLYDDVIDLPIEQVFFITRVALDDNVPAVLNASIRAMHSLFCYRIDETCLDSLLGFGYGLVQPMLTVDTGENSSKEEEEINDQQMAEMDLVKCLARTDILIRIRYIINTVKPTTETIVYCLELLIRLLRDSHTIMMQVYQCEDLFSSIIQHFVPKIYQLHSASYNCYGVPLTCAIKLLRITAARSKTISQELINRFDIMTPICSYISNDIGNNITGVKLQTESLNFLVTLLHYHLAVDSFRELQPFLLRNVNYHFRNTNIDEHSSYTLQSHFAAIMNVISTASLIDCHMISNFVPLLMQCVAKYCSQLSNYNNYQCGKLQIISSLLVTVSNIIKSSPISQDDYVEKQIDAMISSKAFSTITDNIKLGSNLLCEYDSHKSGANFGSVEAAVWRTSEHIVPCLHQKSCLPFLTAVAFYIETSSDKLKLKFLQHDNVVKYLTLLKNCVKLNLTSNWFTRIESQLVINILKSVISVQKCLTDPMFFYELTVKCLCIFNIEQKADVNDLLQNIVFNRQFYPNEVLLEHLRLYDAKDDIMNSLNHLVEIYKCYCDIMGLNKNLYILTTNLTLDVRIGNIMPIDWVFSPIVSMYADERRNIDENRLSLIVTRCLQWIVLYETYFPTLATLVNPTDRFCRLACVFLCSNSLFLDADVHKLLENCLKILLKDENSKNMNFDKEIQGLNNFQDFYVQLLEQYQGVSYGDPLFANYILVPLTQTHNVKWRKILWSEYMGVAQAIMLTKDQCLIDIEEFLNPPETDLSVLKCYRRALVSGHLNRSPLLQEICNYHVENYVKNKKQ